MSLKMSSERFWKFNIVQHQFNPSPTSESPHVAIKVLFRGWNLRAAAEQQQSWRTCSTCSTCNAHFSHFSGPAIWFYMVTMKMPCKTVKSIHVTARLLCQWLLTFWLVAFGLLRIASDFASIVASRTLSRPARRSSRRPCGPATCWSHLRTTLHIQRKPRERHENNTEQNGTERNSEKKFRWKTMENDHKLLHTLFTPVVHTSCFASSFTVIHYHSLHDLTTSPIHVQHVPCIVMYCNVL